MVVRKALRVYCDFYDPDSDTFLKCQYLFKKLYHLRDSQARLRNIGVERLIKTEHLYLLARAGDSSGKSLVEGDSHFIDLAIDSMQEWLKDFDSIKPSLKEECKRDAASSNNCKSNKDYATFLSKQEKKRKKMEDIKKKYTCKKAVYENAKMLDPEGGLLCHTEYKKARWYVQKGLAHILKEGEDELVIQLNFEPNKKAAAEDDEFYCNSNRNACVCCGKDSEYSRFHIVPSIYRTHLPESMKSHRSHDVVLLCFDCLNEGLRQQHRVKKRLADEYDAPLTDISRFYTLNQHIGGMKKISKTLLENWERIP